MPNTPIVLWFRRDLRLADNPVLAKAAASGAPIVPVFVLRSDNDMGAASRVWLHDSLARLATELHKHHLRLILRKGDPAEELARIADTVGAHHVYASHVHEPEATKREDAVTRALSSTGIDIHWSDGALLHDPETLLTKSGNTPYIVFTPFYHAFLERCEPPEPEPVPTGLTTPHTWPESLEFHGLELEPKIDWASGIRKAWTPGEKGAHEALERFTEDALKTYDHDRDRPDLPDTSRLSPYLHFGEISPRQVWHTVHDAADRHHGNRHLAHSAKAYLRQIVWREFAHHLLHHFAHTASRPLHPRYAAFPWQWGGDALEAWKRGRTGYPIVDAGMRELWTTGWMHNRVRMVAASFLVKDLMVHWLEGARWFWDTLVDADLANNTLGWQWVAGCGADASPFFRIFNPVSQGERFDHEGDYVRRWVPELAGLSGRWIHRPWDAPSDALAKEGIVLGDTYPERIVDHAKARERALDAYEELRNGSHP